MTELVVTSPEKNALDAESTSWAAKASSLSIVDKESYVNASYLLKSVKGLRSEIATFWAPHIEAAQDTKRKADAARKALVDEKERMEAPLVAAEGVVKRALLAWDTTQERLRLAQEQQLQAEAQRRAEEQTLAAAAAMELDAQAANDPQMLQEAQDILAEPIEAPVVSVAKAMPKIQGVTYRDQWKAHDIIDIKALAAAVASGQAPSTFMLPNMTAINQFIRATQGTQPIAGVRVYNDRTIAARG